MPRKSEFVLKDSPPDVIAASPNITPKGRAYDRDISMKQTGSVKIDEILLGTKLACVSITDDKQDTLANISKSNPWHEVALTTICGSVKKARRPLTHILDVHFGLTLDHHIDVNKLVRLHAVDTQGFIAHNDDIIVVSFRSSTNALDWMTNFSIASSEWEPDVDLPKGHSGHFSSLDGRLNLFNGGKKKPRVHTGIYNNILNVIPLLEKYVHPLLQPDQPPRTLYVVGHSLGGGVSTLATCHFLLSCDWANLPHRLLNISAGTPRSCATAMANLMEEKLAALRPLGKANVFRVVVDEDVACRVPGPGYAHFGKAIFVTEDGEVLINPQLDLGFREMTKRRLKRTFIKGVLSKVVEQEEERDEKDDNDEYLDEKEGTRNTKYQRLMAKIPKMFRDHCPDCYLEPLVRLCKQENGDM